VKQKMVPHARKLTMLAVSAMLAACGGGGGGEGGAGSGARQQSITFKYPGGGTLLAEPVTLTATADSGLPVSFKSGTPTVCTVEGNKLTLIEAKECLIVASQPGGASADGQQWAPADDVSQLFVVLKKPQVLTFAPPDYLLSSQASSVTLSATADSGLPVTYTVDTPTKCSISGSTLTLLGKGTCAVTAKQDGNDKYAPQSVQAFIAVDPLLLADGFQNITGGKGAGSTDQLRTAQGGGVRVNPWDSTLGSGWTWCGADRPDWCYHTVSADGKTMTSALEVPQANFPTGWHTGLNEIDIFAPNKTSFDGSGDTTTGLRVSTETALGFTMGIPQGLYASGRTIVLHLDLGKRNGGCNVELSTLVWPRQPGFVGYNIPLSNFAVTNSCGLNGVATASLNDQIRQLPNPWDSMGNPTNLAAFNTALDGFKPAREAAATLLGSSDIVRMRLRLIDINDRNSLNGFYSSSISLSGAITIQ
jgi:hypothetical protein